MKIRAWEFALGIFGLLIAALYALTGSLAIGIGFGAATVAGVATRMTPLELPGVAGGHARGKAYVEGAKTISMIVALCVAYLFMVRAAIDHWSRTQQGTVAIFAISGVLVLLLVEISRSGDSWVNWLIGGRTERAVRDELLALPGSTWLVSHNVLRNYGGNIDHIAVAATGAFAIETKSSRYRGADGAQALGGAMALREIAGVGWVTAVVCVPGRQPAARKGPVWVVGRDVLAQWLVECREHRGRPIDVASIRGALEAAVARP